MLTLTETYNLTEHRMLQQSAETSQQLLGFQDSSQDDIEVTAYDICIKHSEFKNHKNVTKSQ